MTHLIDRTPVTFATEAAEPSFAKWQTVSLCLAIHSQRERRRNHARGQSTGLSADFVNQSWGLRVIGRSAESALRRSGHLALGSALDRGGYCSRLLVLRLKSLRWRRLLGSTAAAEMAIAYYLRSLSHPAKSRTEHHVEWQPLVHLKDRTQISGNPVSFVLNNCC